MYFSFFNYIIIYTKTFIIFTTTFVIAISHQILLLVSFGAFTILMFLIKTLQVKQFSLFFLIPPTSAIMAWIFLNETFNIIDIMVS